jgi:hypothetical protein
VPADEAPGYGTTRATTRQTPPQAPLNRGSGPSGRCESDGLKRFGRSGRSSTPQHAASSTRHHSRTCGQLFRGVPRIEVFGRGGIDRTVATNRWACAAKASRAPTMFTRAPRVRELGTFLGRRLIDRGAIGNSLRQKDRPRRRFPSQGAMPSRTQLCVANCRDPSAISPADRSRDAGGRIDRGSGGLVDPWAVRPLP